MTTTRIPATPARASALAMLVVAWLTSCASISGPNAIGELSPTLAREAHVLDQGERRYQASCSACHGTDAHGNGTVSPFLAAPAPDLTLIASRRGGSFPADEVYQIVDGQADLSA